MFVILALFRGLAFVVGAMLFVALTGSLMLLVQWAGGALCSVVDSAQ